MELCYLIVILIFFTNITESFLTNSLTIKSIKSSRSQKRLSFKRLYKKIRDKEEYLIHIEAEQDKNNKFWNVNWSVTPTSFNPSSWIGSFYYGQQSKKEEYLTYFKITALRGQNQLAIPEEAGIYDIRYIQDDLYRTSALIGPFYINSHSIKINTDKLKISPGEELKVVWEIEESIFKKFSNLLNNFYICLNILGDYDECLNKKRISDLSGTEYFKMIPSAGYYVIRLIIENSEKIICLAVSNMLKVSNPEYELAPSSLESVIGSYISGKWLKHSDYNNEFDYIGLFSLTNYPNVKQSSTPIASIRTYAKPDGKFKFIMPPNQEAGPFIIIYFSNQIPVAVSELIQMKQPKLVCPTSNKTMSKIKHLVIICTENHSFDSYFGDY